MIKKIFKIFFGVISGFISICVFLSLFSPNINKDAIIFPVILGLVLLYISYKLLFSESNKILQKMPKEKENANNSSGKVLSPGLCDKGISKNNKEKGIVMPKKKKPLLDFFKNSENINDIVSGFQERTKNGSKEIYKKQKKAGFEIFKAIYQGGLPGFKKGFMKTYEMAIVPIFYGIHCYDTKTYKEFILVWDQIRGVSASEEAKKGFMADFGRASLTGTMANPSSGALDGFTSGLIAGMFAGKKNILCVSFVLNSDDEYIVEAGFETSKNLKVKHAIIEMRNIGLKMGLLKPNNINKSSKLSDEVLNSLEKLSELKGKGILSENEYQIQKNKLLSQ